LRGVVRLNRVFAKIRILGNVGHGLDQPVPYSVVAAMAIRKNGITGQQHRYSGFVGMADFIDSRAFNIRSWEKRTILLSVFTVPVSEFFHALSG
jgi:hypothetical protein